MPFLSNVNWDAQPTDVIMWTDGSCWPQHGPGGWVSKTVIFKRVSENTEVAEGSIYAWGRQKALCTSPLAELKALLEGLRAIPADVQFDSLEIISDSEWMIRSLTGQYARRKHLEVWAEIDILLKKFKEVEPTHIRGHQNVQGDWRVDGNVECDMIADWCRTSDDISIDEFNKKGFVTFENS